MICFQKLGTEQVEEKWKQRPEIYIQKMIISQNLKTNMLDNKNKLHNSVL